MKFEKLAGLMIASVFLISMFGVTATSAVIAVGDLPTEYTILGRPTGRVEIINPSNGDTVSGMITIQIDADEKAWIYIDGSAVVKGYSYNWDTTQYSDGGHTITATVRGGSDQISVTVSNGGSVDNPPVVTITNPTNGATVSGTVTITVTVTDEDALTPDIYIDGTYQATSSSYEWDTTAYSDSSHTIYAEAIDTKTQTGSDQISVTVDNGGSPPPTNMPWWNDLIDAEVAHTNGITGTGSVVVIIDTGLGANWVDLFPQENILTDYCWSQTKDYGIDNVDWNQDTEGHGTACTATVIGYWLDLTDQYVQGVAPDAKIVMIRTIYWIGGGVTSDEMLNAWANAINYARNLHSGALSSYNMVISMSLGYDYTNANLGSAIDNAEAEGIVLATSAGNDGHDTSTTGYPAEYQDTTSVAAAGWSSLTGAYGVDGIFTDIAEGDFSELVIADFSSGGKVDVTGIGWNLVLPQTDGYYYISGTSFSGPQTAGVYALMFDAWGSQTVQWLETKLMNTCYWNSAYMTSFVWGAGFIQADAATV